MSEGADPPAYNAEVARSIHHHGPLHSLQLPPDTQVRPCIIPHQHREFDRRGEERGNVAAVLKRMCLLALSRRRMIMSRRRWQQSWTVMLRASIPR